MSTSELTHSAPSAARGTVIPKLGSLLAFVPLGVWTAWHLWDNLYAFRGAAAWESRVTLPRNAFVELLTSAVVVLPIVLHAIWGLRRLRMSRVNLGRYPFFDNLKYLLQRITALGLLAFLPAHIYLARLAPQIAHGRHERFDEIAHEMYWHGPTLFVYVLGILGAAYHLGNGLATGGMTWGYAATPRAMKRMNAIAIGVFVLLLGAGWGSIYALWSHGSTLPENFQAPVEQQVETPPPARVG